MNTFWRSLSLSIGVLSLGLSILYALAADYGEACWFLILGLMDFHVALER